MSSNTDLKKRLAEAFDLFANSPAEGRKRIERLLAEACDDRQALARALEEAQRELEAARRESVRLEDQHHHDGIRLEQLAQREHNAQAALKRQLEAPEPKRKGYDVPMIRDFLDHLLWEVRIVHFESTAAPGTINPELGEQLKKYMSKYHCALMRATDLVGEGLPEATFQRAARYWRTARQEVTASQIAHLEGLQGLFREAMDCASRRGVTVQRIPCLDVLPPEEGGNPQSPFNAE
jgi:hypothetical protein